MNLSLPHDPPSIAASAEIEAVGIEKSERIWIVALGVFVILQVWLSTIGTSFWLDETGTWWIVKDGPAEAIHRAFSWSGQSPLFYLIEWMSSRVFGLNEIGLRIPSVLAMGGAIAFVYRIAARLCDTATAAIAALLFLCAASFIGVDARPYAVTLLCLTASTWALLRWIETRRTGDAVLYVLTATLTVYAHCIMALSLAAGIVYAFARLRGSRSRLIHMGAMVLSVGILSLPLVPELLHFYTTRSTHTFSGPPTIPDLLNAFIPCSIAGAAALLVWTALVWRREPTGTLPRPETLLLLGLWSLFAPAFLALLAAGTDIHLFVTRYYSSALPGQALLVAALIGSIRVPGVRKALLVVAALAAILTQGRMAVQSHGNENWRDAMSFLRQEAGTSAPVLLVSGFAEGADFRSLADPALREILFAPEMVYGQPARSIHLPHAFSARYSPEMEDVVRKLGHEPRFYLVTENPDRGLENWLAGRLAAQCPSEPLQRTFGYIWVTRFLCGK